MAAQASSSAADVEWKPNASFLAACESLGLDEPAISDGEVKYDAETDTVYAPTREAVAEFRGQPKDDGAPDPLEAAVATARAEKARGNGLLAAGDAGAATAAYEAAIAAVDGVAERARTVLLGRRLIAHDREGTSPLALAAKESKALARDCRLNLAAARLATGDAAGALQACDAAAAVQDLPLEPAQAVKAHFRAAAALEKLGRLKDAEERLGAAAALAPGDPLIAKAIRRTREKRRAKRKAEPKASFKGLFS